MPSSLPPAPPNLRRGAANGSQPSSPAAGRCGPHVLRRGLGRYGRGRAASDHRDLGRGGAKQSEPPHPTRQYIRTLSHARDSRSKYYFSRIAVDLCSFHQLQIILIQGHTKVQSSLHVDRRSYLAQIKVVRYIKSTLCIFLVVSCALTQ